jgi:hypothetical protein
MASAVLARGLGIALALAVCSLLYGCGRGADSPGTTLRWTIDPSSPVAGADTVARVVLRGADGSAVRGAQLTLEAHMTHPGMTPVVSPLRERAPGEYEAPLRLSMPGDWVLVVSGRLPDGRRITRQLDLGGVAGSRTE